MQSLTFGENNKDFSVEELRERIKETKDKSQPKTQETTIKSQTITQDRFNPDINSLEFGKLVDRVQERIEKKSQAKIHENNKEKSQGSFNMSSLEFEELVDRVQERIEKKSQEAERKVQPKIQENNKEKVESCLNVSTSEFEDLVDKAKEKVQNNLVDKLLNSPFLIGCEEVIEKYKEVLKYNDTDKFDALCDLVETTVRNDKLVIKDEIFKELQSASNPYRLVDTPFKNIRTKNNNIVVLNYYLKDFCINYLYRAWNKNKEYIIDYYNSPEFKEILERNSEQDLSQDEFINLFIEGSISAMYNTFFTLMCHMLDYYEGTDYYALLPNVPMSCDLLLRNIADGEFITASCLDILFGHKYCVGIISDVLPQWFLDNEIYKRIQSFKK